MHSESAVFTIVATKGKTSRPLDISWQPSAISSIPAGRCAYDELLSSDSARYLLANLANTPAVEFHAALGFVGNETLSFERSLARDADQI